MVAMSSSHGEITHVSDTALMVAACRGLEFEAPDGFVRDPFAARLAGERGMAILNASPYPGMMRFGVAVRSRFIDELLREAMAANPVAAVLSVGCGLDTRPWRLELPPDLRWIEIDFADMLDYKESLMSSETPRCRRERLIADVNDPEQRQIIYSTAGAAPALMITEGLLMYLPGGTVDALAAEVGDQSGVSQWISDNVTTAFSKAINSDGMQFVRHVQADDSLSGDQILDCIRSHGWVLTARRSYMTDMAFAMPRIQRMMANQSKPSGPPLIPPEDPSGVQLFRR
jgi:methyltransferase (TIGR00027 family)